MGRRFNWKRWAGLATFGGSLWKALDLFITWRDRVDTMGAAVTAVENVPPLGAGFWALVALAAAGLVLAAVGFWPQIAAAWQRLPWSREPEPAPAPLPPLPPDPPSGYRQPPAHHLPGLNPAENLNRYRAVLDAVIGQGQTLYFAAEAADFADWTTTLRRAFRGYLKSASAARTERQFDEWIKRGGAAPHLAVQQVLPWLRTHRDMVAEGDMRLSLNNPGDSPDPLPPAQATPEPSSPVSQQPHAAPPTAAQIAAALDPATYVCNSFRDLLDRQIDAGRHLEHDMSDEGAKLIDEWHGITLRIVRTCMTESAALKARQKLQAAAASMAGLVYKDTGKPPPEAFMQPVLEALRELRQSVTPADMRLSMDAPEGPKATP